MNDLIIRPTAKFLKAGAICTALVFVAVEIVYLVYWRSHEDLSFVPLIAPLLFLWPGIRWLRRRSTQTIVSGDRLRYETGLATKSTRTIQLSKLQDVRVDQGLWQRIFNIGDISMETSGETSRLTIPNVDRPQTIADELMNRSQLGPAPSGNAEGART